MRDCTCIINNNNNNRNICKALVPNKNLLTSAPLCGLAIVLIKHVCFELRFKSCNRSRLSDL